MKKLLALSLVGLLVFTGCGKEEKENNNGGTQTGQGTQQQEQQPQVNTNQGVVEDKVLGEFTFSNTSMIYENGSTTLETTVTNTSAQTSYLKEFNIYAKDAEGNVLVTLVGFVGDNIPAGESKVITSGVSMDLTNAASISYEVVR